MPDYLQIEDVVLIGRTFDEYRRIFALDETTLKNNFTLDAASGVSSFCAEANALGYNVIASDRVYVFNPDEIEDKCSRDLVMVMGQLPAIAHHYRWDFYPDVAALTQHRETAYKAFINDFRNAGTSRYIPTTYPKSSFIDDQFTLTLVSHLLFLYEEQLDYDFHRDTLAELLRITSGEVRIFPMVNLRTQRSEMVNRLIVDNHFAHCTFEVIRVDYEFIKNGNEMLVIRKT